MGTRLNKLRKKPEYARPSHNRDPVSRKIAAAPRLATVPATGPA
jgi:hypothetical protein